METLRDENNRLRQELEQKDILIQELSEEVLRLVKGNITLELDQGLAAQQESEVRSLAQKLRHSEEQLILSQLLLRERDQQISELRQALDHAENESRELQARIDSLPEVYSSKFSERMEPIKSKVEELQKQKDLLTSEIQTLSQRLASSPQLQRIELPEIKTGDLSLPNFGEDD